MRGRSLSFRQQPRGKVLVGCPLYITGNLDSRSRHLEFIAMKSELDTDLYVSDIAAHDLTTNSSWI